MQGSKQQKETRSKVATTGQLLDNSYWYRHFSSGFELRASSFELRVSNSWLLFPMGWYMLTMLLPTTLVLTQSPVAPSSAAAQVFQGHAWLLLACLARASPSICNKTAAQVTFSPSLCDCATYCGACAWCPWLSSLPFCLLLFFLAEKG